MGLISTSDQERLREDLAVMTRPVVLLFFTQALDCETCLQTRQILDELPQLSDKIRIEEVNFILEGDKAARYGIDRVPAIVVIGGEESSAEPGANIRFLGTPAGYEFLSLIHAVKLVGGGPVALSEESRARVAMVDQPLTLHVFTTPTCPHCPRAVTLAHEMAWANPKITAYAVEATEFPDLARRYHVSGVPKTIVNDQVEILGAIPEEAFIEQALAPFVTPAGHESTGTPDSR